MHLKYGEKFKSNKKKRLGEMPTTKTVLFKLVKGYTRDTNEEMAS